MTNRRVSRVGVDMADSLIISGVKSVLTNNRYTAAAASVTARGATVVQGAKTVFVENKSIARAGDNTTKIPIKTGSLTVFAGDNNRRQDLSQLFIVADSAQASGQLPYTKLEKVLNDPSQFYRLENSYAGAKPNFPGTPENTENVRTSEPPIICKNKGLTVIAFLQKCLQESSEGKWRETGQFGNISNPNIISMWRNVGLSYTSDQVPWCAGFACFAMKQSGMKFIKEAGAARLISRAKEYEGKVIPISQMRPGDLVYWNIGHVNFCYTATNNKFTFVGGNQAPGPAAKPPARDPYNDGDVTISWSNGWTPSRGGIGKVVRITC